jgi:hypothetical protein
MHLCKKFDCPLITLQVHLTNVQMRARILCHMRGLKLYTTHMRPLVDNFPVRPDDISAQSVHYVQALGGYLDVTVRQYYVVKHRLRLRHPYFPCVIEYGGPVHNNSHQGRRRGHGVIFKIFSSLINITHFYSSSMEAEAANIMAGADDTGGSTQCKCSVFVKRMKKKIHRLAKKKTITVAGNEIVHSTITTSII